MYDNNNLYEMSQQRQRDLIAEADARRKVNALKQQRPGARRSLPGQFLRMLVTMAR